MELELNIDARVGVLPAKKGTAGASTPGVLVDQVAVRDPNVAAITELEVGAELVASEPAGFATRAALTMMRP